MSDSVVVSVMLNTMCNIITLFTERFVVSGGSGICSFGGSGVGIFSAGGHRTILSR